MVKNRKLCPCDTWKPPGRKWLIIKEIDMGMKNSAIVSQIDCMCGPKGHPFRMKTAPRPNKGLLPLACCTVKIKLIKIQGTRHGTIFLNVHCVKNSTFGTAFDFLICKISFHCATFKGLFWPERLSLCQRLLFVAKKQKVPWECWFVVCLFSIRKGL